MAISPFLPLLLQFSPSSKLRSPPPPPPFCSLRTQARREFERPESHPPPIQLCKVNCCLFARKWNEQKRSSLSQMRSTVSRKGWWSQISLYNLNFLSSYRLPSWRSHEWKSLTGIYRGLMGPRCNLTPPPFQLRFKRSIIYGERDILSKQKCCFFPFFVIFFLLRYPIQLVVDTIRIF